MVLNVPVRRAQLSSPSSFCSSCTGSRLSGFSGFGDVPAGVTLIEDDSTGIIWAVGSTGRWKIPDPQTYAQLFGGAPFSHVPNTAGFTVPEVGALSAVSSGAVMRLVSRIPTWGKVVGIGVLALGAGLIARKYLPSFYYRGKK